MAIFTFSTHSLSEQTPNDKEPLRINKRPMDDQSDDEQKGADKKKEKEPNFDEVLCPMDELVYFHSFRSLFTLHFAWTQ